MRKSKYNISFTQMGNYLSSSLRRRFPVESAVLMNSDPIGTPMQPVDNFVDFSIANLNHDGPSVQRSNRPKNSVSSKKTTVSSRDSNNSDNDVEKLRVELRETKRQVYEREQQLLKLHREIHKLRSVLDHSDVINALKPSLSMSLLLSSDGSKSKQNVPYKKQGVSGESYALNNSKEDPMQSINYVWKDFDCRRIIQEALLDNSFLKNYLNHEQMDLIVDSMYEKEFAKSCYICRRGTYGSHLYVITYGHCEVIDSRDKPVNQMGPGKAFGELALLYNCTRTASVKSNFLKIFSLINTNDNYVDSTYKSSHMGFGSKSVPNDHDEDMS